MACGVLKGTIDTVNALSEYMDSIIPGAQYYQHMEYVGEHIENLAKFVN